MDAAGIATIPVNDEVTKSLYFEDPDGNGVEVYVDVSDVWRREPQRVAQLMPELTTAFSDFAVWRSWPISAR